MHSRAVRGRSRKKKFVIGFYKRKFAFFLCLFLLAYGAVSIYNHTKVAADTNYEVSTSTTPGEQVINLKVADDGKVLVDGENKGLSFKPLGEFDELRVPIVDKPENYIEKLTVNLTLPKPVASKVTRQVLAIHGVDSSYTELTDNFTITYRALGVAQTATVSIVAKMPKGIIDRSFLSKFSSASNTADFTFWVYLALAIPVFTFLFMIMFIRYSVRLNKREEPDRAITAPPMAIPPALVGVLYHQKVTPREIAATLIDLALRKDIYILDRERGFAFGKGRFDQRLLGYEKLLLSKIFHNHISASQENVEQKVQGQMYSKKISLVSAGIYSIATRLGYFRENPRKVHAKYWLFGFLTIVIGLAGFAGSFIFKIMPTFTAFFWVGMMISAVIIIVMASNLPMRTEIGKDALANWLAFKKYLTDPSPIEYSPTVHQLFEAYLPYAIVLDCEAAWARRFAEHIFMVPDWFVSDKNGLGLEDFCLALFPIVSYVGRSLAALREPGFE